MKYQQTISAGELEVIEQFLTGQLDPAEAEKFSLLLLNDPVLQEKTEEVRLLLLGIKEASFEKALRGDQGKVIALPGINTNKIDLKKHGFKWIAAACIVALAGILTWFFMSTADTNTKLYSKYYSPDPGLPTTMSASFNYEFEKAMVEYKNREYNKALQAWTHLSNQRPANDTLNYFIAAANQAIGNDDAAITNLKKVVANTRSEFYKDACWYLGLMLMKKDREEEAIQLLQKSGYQEATSIIQDIRKQ